MTPVRVMVVDDSALMRKMVTEMLSQDERIYVVGQARDGADALAKLDLWQPDVVTLDVEMPVMDGLAALSEIMRRRPTPVVMLSSLTQRGAEMTLQCLERGAVDFVGKPGGSISLNLVAVTAELTEKVIAAARAKISAHTVPAAPANDSSLGGPAALQAAFPAKSHGRGAASRVLCIGASTGGPRALQTLVPALPADLDAPVVVVQHMPAGFTASLAQRLDSLSPLSVREAAEGDVLRPGQVLVAPGGRHLTFDEAGKVHLTDEPPVHGVRPSVDVTLDSLTRLCGRNLTAMVLTGMGRDGARGLKALREIGGATFAEDESTCVVYGMPRAAHELGGAGQMLPLPDLAGAAVRVLRAARKEKSNP